MVHYVGLDVSSDRRAWKPLHSWGGGKARPWLRVCERRRHKKGLLRYSECIRSLENGAKNGSNNLCEAQKSF